MVFEGYSKRALTSIFIARHIAGRHGASVINTNHLLLALVYEDQGETGKALSDAPELQGVVSRPIEGTHESFFPADVASDIIRKLEDLLPQGKPLASSAEIPMESALKEALRIAGSLRSELGQNRVEPLHLLAGILKKSAGEGASVLRRAGVSEEKVREAIARLAEGSD